jgi:integrase
MNGHIRRRGKTSWAIVLDLGHDASGKRRQKWHTVKGTKRDAERERARLINEVNSGAYVEPSQMRVSEYLLRWLRDYAEPKVSAKTYERYADMITNNLSPALGAFQLSKLRPLDIQSFYTDALTNGRRDGCGGLSAQTVLHFHRVLHKALSQAVKWQLLARNPAEAVEPPKPQRKKMRALDEAETARLLNLVEGTRLYVPVHLAVTTGLRRGEILALRWQDIDFEAARAEVTQSLEQTRNGLRFKRPKTSQSRRLVALPALTVEVLRVHRIEQTKERLSLGSAYTCQGLVCARADGEPWPPDAFSTCFAAFIRQSDFPHVRFHDLRHTHATHLLRQGVHPKVVSERLGHSKIGITLDTYSHVLPGMQEAAAQQIDALLRRTALTRKND